MAVTLVPVAGQVVEVSATAPSAFTETAYNVPTYTAVGGFDNIANFGDAYEMQTFDSVAEGRIPYRGIQDGGGGEMSMADDPADPGQILLKAAFDAAKGSTAEKITVRIRDENDNYIAFQAIVGSWGLQFGGANDVKRRMAELRAIPGSIVEGSAA